MINLRKRKIKRVNMNIERRMKYYDETKRSRGNDKVN